MQKLLLILTLLCGVLIIQATDLVIEKTDGSSIRIDITQIKTMRYAQPELTLNPDTHLLAYWPLDGDGKDESGAGLHATNSGTRPCMGVNGKEGSALRFEGSKTNGDSGNHLVLPFIDLAKNKQFSICLWVKETRMENGDGEGYIWFGDHFQGALGIVHFYKNIEFLVGKTSLSVPFQAEFIDNWVHYALVMDNNTVRGYINGKEVGSKEQALQLGSTNAALGRHWWSKTNSSTRFTGCMDEVRIYSRALSVDEIKSLIKASK